MSLSANAITPIRMSRSYLAPDEDHQPLTWVQGRPLYAVHLIVAGLALTILGTALLEAFGAQAFLGKLAFDSTEVHAGEAWRAITYGLVNHPSIPIAIDIALLLWFGQDVERFVGRRHFLRLYAFIYFIPPLLLTALGFLHPMVMAGQTGALAVFVAFATLTPNATVCLNINANWAAAILVAIYTLMALAAHYWAGLAALWGTTAYAFAFVRHQQGLLSLPIPNFRRARSAEPTRTPATAAVRIGGSPRVSSANSSAASASRTSPGADMAEVDALLDKISSSGLESLTPREHERLAAAQARLARRYEQNRS